MSSFSIIKPDDFHLHLRDSPMVETLVNISARQWKRALIMPNLKLPIYKKKDAESYRDRIVKNLDKSYKFIPLMSLYLTDNTTGIDIKEAAATDYIKACKLYPSGATTNSSNGVTDIKKIYPVLKEMELSGLLLLIHGEVTDQNIDIFDREAIFIERYLKDIVLNFPNLKIIMEHITTKDGVDFILNSGPNVAATITAHHLLYSRNALFVGGIRPHMYCLPILKSELHRKALLDAVATGNPKFFAGTDSAPHSRNNKENCCGCAGCFTAPIAIELYVEAMEEALNTNDMNLLREKVENFCSIYGANFYGLPLNSDEKITLIKREQIVPAIYKIGEDDVVPIRANEKVNWSILD